MAVDLASGNLKGGFSFSATGSRGGGLELTCGLHGLARDYGQYAFRGLAGAESPNHGLSMLRLDLNTGAVVWKHQPVPFSMDNDPDWSATPAITWDSCGTVVVSTQKDGWTWAVDETSSTSSPSVRWAFPPGPWSTGGFHPADGTVHGDTDYKRPGTAWGDVYVASMGGYDTVSDLSGGYTRLHALNVCASDKNRVRWVKDIPGTSGGPTYPLIILPLLVACSLWGLPEGTSWLSPIRVFKPLWARAGRIRTFRTACALLQGTALCPILRSRMLRFPEGRATESLGNR